MAKKYIKNKPFPGDKNWARDHHYWILFNLNNTLNRVSIEKTDSITEDFEKGDTQCHVEVKELQLSA